LLRFNIIKFISFSGTGQVRTAFKILVGKPEGRRLLWRTRHRGENNIKMEFKRIVLFEGVN
jgi:hypothetical protein